MLKVGLTGGIGAGKSAVAQRLARLGAVLVDADVLAREVVAPGSEGLREIVARFGPDVLTSGGSLDRSALGARVFGDAAARRALESIIHPRVRARTAELTAAAPSHAIVVNDVPLLVETGLSASYHLVVVVTTDESTRVARLMRDRGMSQAEAYARIRAQADEEQRRAAADVLLANDATPADLDDAVRALWRDRLVPFEANLRLARPAEQPARPTIVEPDASWPRQTQRLMARLARALGDGALRLDHVGPTSVPGLPAVDVIDIQAVVPRLDVESLAAGSAAAGFVGLPDRCRRAARGSPEHAQFTALAADPGRAVTVVFRPVSCPAWREALLLRDWLRADGEARARHVTAAGTGSPQPKLGEGCTAGWGETLSAALGPACTGELDETRGVELDQAWAWARKTGWTP